MEDSYTVHRRRKAAARKREKTPDPKRTDDKESGEEDDASLTRSKMIKMVRDTESMIGTTDNNDKPEFTKNCEKKSTDENDCDLPDVNRTESTIETKSETVGGKILEQDKFRSDLASKITEPRDTDVKTAMFSKNSAEFESNDESGKDKSASLKTKGSIHNESKDVEQILESPDAVSIENIESAKSKKRSKEKYQLTDAKRTYTDTESTDTDEKMIPLSIRRKVSSEDNNKTSRKLLPVNSEQSTNKSRSNRDKKSSTNKLRSSTGLEEDSTSKKVDDKPMIEDKDHPEPKPRSKLREKRSISRHRYPSDSDDELLSLKKSETFPQKLFNDKNTIKRSSSSDMKKQIIPLNDDSLIKDFAKAQENYLKKERGILSADNDDDQYFLKTDSKILRKRKLGILYSDRGEIFDDKKKESGVDKPETKRTLFSWFNFDRKKEKIEDKGSSDDKLIVDKNIIKITEKATFIDFLRAMREVLAEFRAYARQNPAEIRALKKLRNSCIGELILIIIYCGLGAFVFRFTEGAFETFYKCGVKRVKRDFLDNLWNYSHNMREDDWKSMARRKLMEFEEQLHNAHEAGVHSYSGQKSWTFLNSVSYCLTVITTIGYGHISPRTMAGQAITIVYAIFGIPIFLIILADFGKLFTRGIKFLWAFVRRLYYTGSCRKVRRTVPVQEVMKGVQLVYDFATFKRPSQINPEDVEEMQRHQQQQQTILNLDGNVPQPETPGTPAMSNFAIDDEFNLPISVAISILLGYIFVGATAYHMFEEWDFFESFYFVFISMSTIGFGDFVPKNPIFMMFSIVYLVFGLALTSMCINVVQTVLSDSFKQASQKISATIGFEVPADEIEDNNEVAENPAGVVEISDVQTTMKEPEEINEEIAPKAKQEEVNL